MKATSWGDHLVQLSRQGWVNAYLVREQDGFTLIDTMIPGSAKGILAAAQAAGGPIVRIAVTHGHLDHVASVDALRAALPGAELLVPARDLRIMNGDRSLEPGEARAKLRGSYRAVKSTPRTALEPGDRVGSLEVVAAPGHTPGSVAYLDSRDRGLVCGDALQTLGGIAVAGVVRPLFPFPAMATWSKETARESATGLRALEPGRLAPGHGGVLERPLAAMDEAIAAAG